MRTSDVASVRSRCGICTNRVKPPRYFRSCPMCDAENRERYEETYWRRLFQVTGVEICPKHEVILNSTNIRFHPQSSRHRFFAAEKARLRTSAKPIDQSDTVHHVLLQFAKDAEWLLTQEKLNPSLDFIHERYFELLRQKSLATRGGFVRISELKRQFREHFTPKILELLQSPVPDDNSSGWLARMLRTSRNSVAPLRHLLLMNFLGISPGGKACRLRPTCDWLLKN